MTALSSAGDRPGFIRAAAQTSAMGVLDGAELIRGFDACIREGIGIVARGREVAVLSPVELIDEFVLPLLEKARALRREGRAVRLVCIGAPPEGLAAVLADDGVDVRVVDEHREVGFVVTDMETLFFPAALGPESMLTPFMVLLRDAVAVAHLRLAFERAWARARPLAAPGRGGTTPDRPWTLRP